MLTNGSRGEGERGGSGIENIQEEGDEGTGWRRSIGCLISWITFRKLATNYRALLRKMTYKDKGSYESSPPCIGIQIHSCMPII